ncbi:uncharacterized protein VTP21DRAFT_6049 [Calcarisporiella thermophila]|uniref:uncharacterized protein n=1 Tax=Calcarisporiella thermophila TaxID=911321 RepID=UPI00374329F3
MSQKISFCHIATPITGMPKGDFATRFVCGIVVLILIALVAVLATLSKYESYAQEHPPAGSISSSVGKPTSPYPASTPASTPTKSGTMTVGRRSRRTL